MTDEERAAVIAEAKAAGLTMIGFPPDLPTAMPSVAEYASPTGVTVRYDSDDDIVYINTDDGWNELECSPAEAREIAAGIGYVVPG
jgi:hypothetical protein